MHCKNLVGAMTNDSTLEYEVRVAKGRAKENRIMVEMRKQCKLDVTRASNRDDILRGIDCYLKLNNEIWPTQIKARQSSEDLLFVITEDKKPGKDMKTQAKLYAFLIYDKLYLIKTSEVRSVIANLQNSIIKKSNSTKFKFRISYKGVDCELSLNNDPVTGTSKLMAFIPTDLFTDVIEPIMQPCNLFL